MSRLLQADTLSVWRRVAIGTVSAVAATLILTYSNEARTIVMLVGAPFAAVVAVRSINSRMAGGLPSILLSAYLILRALAAAASIWVAGAVYGGVADAIGYHNSGIKVANSLGLGDPVRVRAIPGTGSMDWLMGVLYSIGEPHEVMAGVVFASFSAVGAVLLWAGLGRNLPPRSQKLLGILMLFVPSVWFWSAWISKEAVIIFGLGLAVASLTAIAASRIRFCYIVGLAGGALPLAAIRPHILLLLIAAATVAAAWTVVREGKATPGLLAICLLCIAVLPIAVTTTGTLLGATESVSFLDAADQRLAGLQAVGEGSSFEAVQVNGAADIPNAVVTALFRPYIWEARNPGMILAAVEASAIAFLGLWACAAAFRRGHLGSWGFNQRFALLFVLGFSTLFASTGNFGLLARQRIQVVPFLLFLLVSLIERRSEAADPEVRVTSVGSHR